MRLFFLLVRRVPPVMSPVLAEVFGLLEGRGFRVETGIAEEMLARPDRLAPAHDLYILKSHTELSLSLAGILDLQGARVMNPYRSCALAQNKIVASRILRAAGVPVPRTWVTGDLKLLGEVVEETPLIIKPYVGHRGAGIHVVRRPSELPELAPTTAPVVVQEYVEGGGEDLKVYVVGEEVFAVRKPFSEMSFTQPGRPVPVSDEVRRIALSCGRAFGLSLYGLDIIEGRDRPFVVDLNYFPGYKGVPRVAPLIADCIESFARGREGYVPAPETSLPCGFDGPLPATSGLPLSRGRSGLRARARRRHLRRLRRRTTRPGAERGL